MREGWRALDVRFEGERAAAVTCRPEHGGDPQTIEAAWVVDATGQSGLIGRRLSLRQPDDFFRNLAVYSYFRGAQRLEGIDSGNIFIEAFAHGWTWAIPLPDDIMSVGVVADAAWAAERLTEQQAAQFLEAQLAATTHTSRMLASAERLDEARIVRDWSYVSERLVGDGYILVGDAACFIDPLFSSGVHLALILRRARCRLRRQRPAQPRNARPPPPRSTPSSTCSSTTSSAKWPRSSTPATAPPTPTSGKPAASSAARTPSPPAKPSSPPSLASPLKATSASCSNAAKRPPDFVQGVAAVEQQRAERERAAVALIDRHWPERSPLLDCVPILAEGVQLERKPVVGDGEFEWGAVVSSPSRPHGAPISLVVARLLQGLDGAQSARQIIDAMLHGLPDDQRAQLLPGLLTALRVLYVDGMIARFDAQ